MARTNPGFTQSGAFSQDASPELLEKLYNAPSAKPSEPMTVEDTVAKTALSFGLVVIAAVFGWMFTASNPAAAMSVVMVASIAGLVLAMVNIFKRQPSAGLILLYSAVQGVWLGAISFLFETLYPGIVLQAVLATLSVFAVTLVLFASGKVRASARATKVFMIALIGYFVFSIVNVFVMIFGGAGGNAWGLNGSVHIFGIPLGVILGILVVILGAYSLVLDFDAVQQGVRNRAPKQYAWQAAFGIMVTMIWLYTEILRMLAIARQN